MRSDEPKAPETGSTSDSYVSQWTIFDMKPRITVLTLGVDDLERTLAFYSDGLGLHTDGIFGKECEHGAVAFFDLQAGVRLAIWARADIAHDAGLAIRAPSATEFTIGHNVKSAQEVDAVMAQARLAGARIVTRAQRTFWGGYAGYPSILTDTSGKSFGTPRFQWQISGRTSLCPRRQYAHAHGLRDALDPRSRIDARGEMGRLPHGGHQRGAKSAPALAQSQGCHNAVPVGGSKPWHRSTEFRCCSTAKWWPSTPRGGHRSRPPVTGQQPTSVLRLRHPNQYR